MFEKWYYYTVKSAAEKDGWRVCKGHPVLNNDFSSHVITSWKRIPAKIGKRIIEIYGTDIISLKVKNADI